MLAPLTALAALVQAVALAGPSTTTIAISPPESAYGQTVTATATVTTAPGPAQGDVVFSVDGLAIKANLGASGTATAVLPAALVGQHAVSATFVPQFPDSQQGSTSPTQPWVVAQVRTRLQVRVVGKGARIPTSVQVKAAGEYGSRPAGRMRVVLHRIGTRRAVRSVETLDSTGTVLAGFGRLRKGDYRLTLTYGGDTQHLGERKFERFHVRRR